MRGDIIFLQIVCLFLSGFGLYLGYIDKIPFWLLWFTGIPFGFFLLNFFEDKK